MDRIVYSTDWKNNNEKQNQSTHRREKHTVTIDYDQTLQLFLSQSEHIEFSPQRMLRMVNSWVRANAARITASKRLLITADRHKAHCELTPVAVNALSHLYFGSVDWQEEYPQASRVLNKHYTVVIAL